MSGVSAEKQKSLSNFRTVRQQHNHQTKTKQYRTDPILEGM